MALTWALCAAPGRRRRPLPCWASPSPLIMGAGTTADPPEGKTPACCCSCSPPLWTGRHRCPPPNTLGCPSWWRLQQCRTPLCPLHDLHAGALCSSHKVCMGRRGCPTLLPPARCALFCGGEGGRDSACCPVTAPGGGFLLRPCSGCRRRRPPGAVPWGMAVNRHLLSPP